MTLDVNQCDVNTFARAANSIGLNANEQKTEVMFVTISPYQSELTTTILRKLIPSNI